METKGRVDRLGITKFSEVVSLVELAIMKTPKN